MATSLDASPMAEPIETRKSDFIDVGAIMRALRRRQWLFVGVGAVLAILVLVAYFFITPRFDATSEVVVNTQTENVVAPTQQVVTAQAPPDTYAVDTEVTVLKSRSLARNVVERLKLWNDPEFAQAAMTAEADPKTRSPNAQIARARAIEAATDTVIANRTIARTGTSFEIDITYSSLKAATAAAVANAMAEDYVRGQLDTKVRATLAASGWLQERLNGLRSQVLAADAAVQRYRAQNGLLETSPTETTTQQSLGDLSTQLATAQADAAEKQARANTARMQLRSGSIGDDVGESLGSSTISQLRQQRAQVSGTVADLSTRYGPRHPDLVRAQNQLKDIDAQIAAEIKRTLSGLDAQARIANGRVGSLQGSMSNSKGTLAANSAAGVRLAELQRNADAVRTLYETYLNRYRETSSQAGLAQADARVLAYASEPSDKASPKLVIFLALAVLAGLVGGGGAVAIAEMLDRSLRSSRDVEAVTGLRTVASIPDYASTLTKAERKASRELNTDIVVDRPFSAFAESFRMLLAGLRDPATGRLLKVVALTSSLPQEGKTTSAICLSRVAAIDGHRTILVECDTRRAGLRASRTATEFGILEVLSGKATLEQAVQRDARSGAYLLPVSGAALASGDVLSATAMASLLATLREQFDLVILDTAPVLAIAESRLVAAQADAVVHLARWGSTPSSAVAAGVRALRETGVAIVGVVLTRVDLNRLKLWTANDGASYFSSYSGYYS